MPLLFTSKKKFDIEVSKQATAACDQIINEMGAEIHDDLIQKLVGLTLCLDRLERSYNDPEETLKLITSMRSDFADAANAVRSISRNLMPVRTDDDSFETRLGLLCQTMSGSSSGKIQFSQDGKEQELPLFVQNHLIRISQELIHNAFKHSSAWHVWLRLYWEPTKLRLEVEDDGTAFQHLSESITTLRKKHNSLRMRSDAIGARPNYQLGKHGLLAAIELPLKP